MPTPAAPFNLEYLSIKLPFRDSEPPSLEVSCGDCAISSSLTISGDLAIIGAFLDHINAPQLRTFSINEMHYNSNSMAQKFSSHLRTLVTKYPALRPSSGSTSRHGCGG